MNTTHSRTRLGFDEGSSVAPDSGRILPVIRLKMMATGLDLPANGHGPDFMAHTADLIRKIQEKFRGYPQPLCPLDARLQAFLDAFFADTDPSRPPGSAPAHPAHGFPRPGAHAFHPRRRGPLRIRIPEILPDRSGRAPQSRHRQAHHQGHLPRVRGRPAHRGRQEGRAQGRLRRPALERPQPPRPPAGAALSPPASKPTDRNGRPGARLHLACSSVPW